MIYPKKNPIIFWSMHFFAKWVVWLKFERVLFNDISVDKNKSVLLIANHYSAFDALILYIINNRLLKKKMHIMILEKTAGEYFFFRFANTFTIKKGSKDMLASLNFAAELLDDPANLVLIYPQGQLYSNFVSHINFGKGVLRIIKQAQGKFQLVYAAAFVQYFKTMKPTAIVYLKTDAANYAGKNITDLQQAYQQYYDECKLLQTEIDIEA